MATNSPDGGRVYTLDLPQDQIDRTGLQIDEEDRKYIDKVRSGERFIGTPVAHEFTQLYGDSATFDFAPYVGKIDLIAEQ
jgi:hypothetical protein